MSQPLKLDCTKKTITQPKKTSSYTDNSPYEHHDNNIFGILITMMGVCITIGFIFLTCFIVQHQTALIVNATL
jgi:hypothetical protein